MANLIECLRDAVPQLDENGLEAIPDVRSSPLSYCRDAGEKSILPAIWTHKLRRIQSLFSGGTSEADEDQALAIMLSVNNTRGLLFLVNQLTWDTLDDELDEPDLDQIANRLSELLDRHDHNSVGEIVTKLFRNPSSLTNMVPADITNNFTNGFSARTTITRRALIDELLAKRDRLLNDTSILALRKIGTHAELFKLIVQAIPGIENHRAAEVTQLDWELFYTNHICFHLERGETRLIFNRLPDLVDAQLSNAQRNAFFLMLQRWDNEFRALEEIVNLIGTAVQKVDMTRFIDARQVFMDNFPQVAPPPTLLQQIADQLGLNAIVDSIQDLRNTIASISLAIEAIGDLPKNLFDAEADDEAVRGTNGLAPGNLIAVLPTAFKHRLIAAMIEGSTEDDEEQAILTILRTSKARSPAEFLQLVRMATWEQLDVSFNGQEYDELESLFTL